MSSSALGQEAAARWSDFIALDDDDLRELVDGQLMDVEGPSKLHEHVVSVLILHLAGWARHVGRGRVLGSGYRVRIDDTHGVMPDVQLLSDETYQRAEEDGLTDGRPELVIEVSSPSSRSHDRVRKLSWYASLNPTSNRTRSEQPPWPRRVTARGARRVDENLIRRPRTRLVGPEASEGNGSKQELQQ